MVPEDRRAHGLLLPEGAGFNIALPNLASLSSRGLVNDAKARTLSESWVSRLRIRTPSLRQPVSLLSGGNQQKVVFAKWLARSPKVLILDEPTRGVDVGARGEIYTIIDDLAAQGLAVWMISSDTGRTPRHERPHCRAARRPPRRHSRSQRFLRRNHHATRHRGPLMKRIAGVVILLAVLYALLWLLDPKDRAMSWSNLKDVLSQQAFFGVLTLGAGVLIVTGGIDLSIGSVVGLSAVLFGVLMEDGMKPYAAMAIVLAAGMTIGAIHAALITKLKLQAFLVTLCGLFVYRGLARMLAPAGRSAWAQSATKPSAAATAPCFPNWPR